MLRSHRPLGQDHDRSESHAVVAEVLENDEIRYAQVPRLSASMHDEWVVHGSGDHYATTIFMFACMYVNISTILTSI